MSTERTIQWAEYKKEGGLLLVAIIFSAAMLIYLWADFQEKQQEKLRLNQLHDELVFDIDQAAKDKTLLNEIGASFLTNSIVSKSGFAQYIISFFSRALSSNGM